MTLLLIGVVGGLIYPEKTYAQNIDRLPGSPSVTTNDKQIYREKGLRIVQEQIDYVKNKQSDPTRITMLGGTDSTQYKQYTQDISTLLTALEKGKADFTEVYDATVGDGSDTNKVLAAYSAALIQVKNRELGISRSYGIFKSAPANADLAYVSNQIDRASEEPKRTLQYSSNPTDNANANAINTQIGQNVKDTAKPAECAIFSWNIASCLDAGFAWLVKNTLLQVAGFLAWLAANMLNFAIQFSVLDFAKWSPTSLYPIWVIIRQIVSLVVVFAGLYLGFMYIIGREDTFGKYIGWLAIFALFVNFSYPVTRALVDVSNIVSLNIYSSVVGSEVLGSNFGSDITTSGGNTAGSLIMNRLGLTDLFVSATKVDTGSGFTSRINSTPGALVAVVFALYAAYVLFMATALIIMRAIVFSFLIVASPLLLVDAVVPKLGEVAVKMRKMFFEQLIVAPVFMIMLALTLRFMDVFQTTGGAENIKIFFNLTIMIVMLHIMLKVTKATAGAAGEMATNAMGKVGGFGLGVASGGAGLLARGSVGIAAARMRDSGWMDKMQGSRTGRGLYGLSNSLAQSTFDARNIGMVNRGMASAGMGMGKGTTQTYDKDFEAKDLAMKKKYGSIKDGSARDGYIAQKTSGVGANWLQSKGIQTDAQVTAEKIKKGEDASVKKYTEIKDEDKKREYLESLPENVQTRIRNEGGASQIQTTKAEAVADEQRTNPTEEAKMMSAAEIAEMQKNFKAAANQPNYQEQAGSIDVTKESFAERRKMKQAEAQRNIDRDNTEGGVPEQNKPAPKPSSPSPASAEAVAA